jgi:hypothetical protein
VVSEAINTSHELRLLDVSDEAFAVAAGYSSQFGLKCEVDRRLPWRMGDSMSSRSTLRLPNYMELISLASALRTTVGDRHLAGCSYVWTSRQTLSKADDAVHWL